MTQHDDKERAPRSEHDDVDAFDSTDGIAPEHASVPRPRRPRDVYASFAPGTLVADKFELVRPLSQGGMGDVFVARDRQLMRRVALKTLRVPSGASDEEQKRFLQLFRRDSSSTAHLNHPGIVTVYQTGEHEGVPFMALELVEGRPLDLVLAEDGPMPERRALELAEQLAGALHYAHQRGIVHRDIKPSNLVLTLDGRLKILDFGIALMRDARDSLRANLDIGEDTLSEHIGDAPRSAGTPMYMAPEQISGGHQDARSDTWALGVTLYEVLVGSRPYRTPWQINGAWAVEWPEASTVSPRTRALIHACLRPDIEERTRDLSALATDFGDAAALLARSASPDARRQRTNLEARSDAFVGRHRDLDDLDALLLLRAAPLVTVAGPGGMGKTRLVTQWALGALERDDGVSVFFCDLTESTDALGVLIQIAQAVGIPLAREEPAEQLGAALEGRRGLILILDNCEQVIEPLARLIPQLRKAAPSLRLLLTSRIPVELHGERVLRLEHLAIEGQSSEAAELFAARAREVRRGWVCPEDEREAFGALLRELDGLPLAIELAAARASILSPKKMLARMSRRFDILRSSRRDLTARQTTLLGAVEWSWDLLSELERGALTQLAVFEGGFTLELAEDVLAFDGPFFVVELLERLVDVSLLRVDPATQRFQMWVSVHAFARRELASSPGHDDTRRRHLAAMARVASHDAVLRISSHNDTALLAEIDNLGAASTWALDRADLDHELVRDALVVTRAELALLHAHRSLVDIEPYIARLDRARGLAPRAECEALIVVSKALLVRSALEDAKQRSEYLLALSESLGDAELHAKALIRVGSIDANLGHAADAVRALEQACELAERAGAHLTLARATGYLAFSVRMLGQRERARALLERAAELSRRARDTRHLGYWIGGLGNTALSTSRYELAEELYLEALEIARSIDDTRGETNWLGCLSSLAINRGQSARAAHLASMSLDLARSTGDRSNEIVWLGNLGLALVDQGDHIQGVVFLRGALALAQHLGHTSHEYGWRLKYARALLSVSRVDEAEDAIAPVLEAQEHHGATSIQRAEVDSLLAGIESARGRHDEARVHFERAIEVFDRDEYASLLSVLAHGVRQARLGGDLERAERYIDRALERALVEGNTTRHVEALMHRGQLRPEKASACMSTALAVLQHDPIVETSGIASLVRELAETLGTELPEGIFVPPFEHERFIEPAIREHTNMP